MATFIGDPPGTVKQFAGSVAPTGYLICDGSTVSRATYAALFTAIGIAYGAGDGSTTFGLPDGRGRVLVGLGTHADVGTLANNEGASLGARRVKHKHTSSFSVNDPGHNHGGVTSGPSIGIQEHSVGNNSTWGVYSGGNWDPTPTSAHTHTIPSSGTSISVTGNVGPQTGNEPTDSAAYLVITHIIKT